MRHELGFLKASCLYLQIMIIIIIIIIITIIIVIAMLTKIVMISHPVSNCLGTFNFYCWPLIHNFVLVWFSV